MVVDNVEVRENETIDELQCYNLKIIQKKDGYRFSLDAILLADFASVSVKDGDRIVDLGTGSSVIALILAGRTRAGEIVGVEIQKDMVDIASRNVVINNLEEKVKIKKQDIRNISKEFEPESFDVVVINPPYRKIWSGRINPIEEKAIARHEIKGTIQEFIKSSNYLVKRKGKVVLIYHPLRLVELLVNLRKEKLEPKNIRLVHSQIGTDAKLVLIEAIKNGQEGLKILPPLYVYQKDKVYSNEMARIYGEVKK